MIDIADLHLMLGGKTLLQQSSARINPGERVALVGRNGAGKSSLFALLRGELSADEGSISVPKQWRIGHVKQETPALDIAALDYALDGDVQLQQLQQQLAIAEEAHDGHRIAQLHDELAAIDAYTAPSRAATLLAGLGFEQNQLSAPVASFSGGWRMRLNLAQALMSRADLLLLDEPTNHLDLDALVWLEQWLKAQQATIIVISHDRDFLDNVANRVIHIDQQTLVSYTGNYSSFEQQRVTRLMQQQAAIEQQNRQRAHLQQFVDRFRAKASKAKQAQSRLKMLERMETLAPLKQDSDYHIRFKNAKALPFPLLRLEDVSAGYNQQPLLKHIQFNLTPGANIALLGRNGAGKSTLIKTLAGELAAVQGQVVCSQGLQIGYFAQHQVDTLDKAASPLQLIKRLDPQTPEQQLRDYLGGFAFNGDMATEPCGKLSGGQSARLALALIIWQKPNLLLLDEPTNHLDLDMREALVDALQEFEGAMVLVSHDRHLINACCDDLYLVANGEVQPWKEDLAAYQQWLLKAENSTSSSDGDSDEADDKVDRKAQKRLEAQMRQQTKPLRDTLSKLEKQQEKLQQQLDTIEVWLGDSSAYDSANKDKLQQQLQQQGQLRSDLEEIEMQWFECQEQLEQLQQQLASN